MSRRKRKILIVTLITATAILSGSWYVWENGNEQQIYIPGEQVEGLTSRLMREIPDDYTALTFRDVTMKAGIEFQHFNYNRTSQLAEDMGSGVAWFDYNNDGWDDLFLVNYAATLNQPLEEIRPQDRCKLYENNGDGTFTDISSQSGANLAIRGMGVAVADYDNDGWTDLFITGYGKNILLRNRGDGTFGNVTEEAGLNAGSGFWAGASWGDYDRDGHLDLYVTGYVQFVDSGLPANKLSAEEPPSINPSSFKPVGNLLYHNNGDGTFTEVARIAGVENSNGRSLSASWVDLDNDLWPDLYVANDVSDNVLYLNRRDGTFMDVSYQAYVADYRGAMGIGSGDWDNDLDMDLFITHWIAQENALYTNQLNDEAATVSSKILRFKDDSDNQGLGQSSLDYIGWATSFVDLNMDTRLDLYIINGSTNQIIETPHKLQPMQDQIFWNAGRERGFYDVSHLSGAYFRSKYVGRGGAYSDYDGDGDLDLIVVNHNGPAVLLENEHSINNNWLIVHLEGSESNRSAIGARLRLVAGKTVQIRQVGSQSTYLSHNSLSQHFGLGDFQKVDTLEVQWPSGQKDIYLDLSAGQEINIMEGQANYTSSLKPEANP